MKTRLNMRKTDPEAIKVMGAIETYLAATELAPLQKELIKIRASQINGCAYCVDLHTRDARKLGETEQRINTIIVWRDTPFFSDEERAILALTEEVTLIQHRVKDDTYESAVNLLGEKRTAQVLMAIIAINAWNRIGVATEMKPS